MPNPYTIGIPVIDDKFYNRQQIIEELIKFDETSYFLNGLRRIGKTSILKQLEHSLELSSNILPIYLSLDGHDNAIEMGKELHRAISNRLENTTLSAVFDCQDDETFEGVLQQWINYCRQNNQKSMLLVDECEVFHYLDDRDVISLYNLLINHTQTVKVIIAGTRNFFNDIRPPFINFSDFFKKKYVGHFAQSDIISLIRQSKSARSKITISNKTIKIITENCGGHPYLLQLACSRLYEGGNKRMNDVDDISTFAIDQGLHNFFGIDYNSLNEKQQEILKCLTKNGKSSSTQIEKICQISNEIFISAIAELVFLGIVRYEADRFDITYSLFKKWIAMNKLEPEIPENFTQTVNIVTLFAQPSLSYLVDFRLNCLDILMNKGLIQHWDNTDIIGGEDIDLTTTQRIQEADIIIGLICPVYFSVEHQTYSYHKMAMELSKRFVPIIAKTGYYDLEKDIINNAGLPRRRSKVRPIDQWDNKNEAWSQIAEELHKIVTM